MELGNLIHLKVCNLVDSGVSGELPRLHAELDSPPLID